MEEYNTACIKIIEVKRTDENTEIWKHISVRYLLTCVPWFSIKSDPFFSLV